MTKYNTKSQKVPKWLSKNCIKAVNFTDYLKLDKPSFISKILLVKTIFKTFLICNLEYLTIF